MQTKYTSGLGFWWTRAYRAAVRSVLRTLVRWDVNDLDDEACTLVLGCDTELVDMLPGNLGCLARQNLTHVREILLVFDSPPRPSPADLQRRLAALFPALPCRIVVYSLLQRAVVRSIRWAWVNCWLSWCLGIAQARTRWVMLHDFDAMLVDPEFVERRFAAIRERECRFLGIIRYDNPGNGVVAGDGLAATIEMMLDASFVRSTFAPIDAFNHVTTYKGRRVDFDTFLWVQSRAGSSHVIPVDLADLVHPSQMICQYASLRLRDGRVPLDKNNLMLIPHFISVGGDLRLLREVTAQLERAGADGSVTLFERRLDLGPLVQEHLDWIIKQASHLDRALFGEVRPEVRRYLDALARFVGGARATRGRGLIRT